MSLSNLIFCTYDSFSIFSTALPTMCNTLIGCRCIFFFSFLIIYFFSGKVVGLKVSNCALYDLELGADDLSKNLPSSCFFMIFSIGIRILIF
jgi:hypothetical protein